jgi:hypothetical protein
MGKVRKRVVSTVLSLGVMATLLLFFSNCTQSNSSGSDSSNDKQTVPSTTTTTSSTTTSTLPFEAPPWAMDLERSTGTRYFGALGISYGATNKQNTTLSCLDPVNRILYKKTVLSTLPSESASLRARPDGLRAAVLSRVFKIPGNYSSRTYQMWMVDDQCAITAGPIERVSTSEYRSMDVNASHVVLATTATANSSIEVSILNSNLVETKHMSFARPLTFSNYAFKVVINTSGQILLTSQGHQGDPVFYRRFLTDGTEIDSSWQTVAGTPGNHSSFYDSHYAGLNDSGDFVIVAADSPHSTVWAYFQDSTGAQKAAVQLNTAITTGSADFDELGREFKIQASGSKFLIPDHWAGTYNFPDQISVYTSQGVFEKTLQFPPTTAIFDTRKILSDANQFLTLRIHQTESFYREQKSW